MRYIGDGSLRDDPDQLRATLEVLESKAAEHPGFGLVVAHERESGAFVGWAALKPLDGREEFEVGYRLARASWGQGFATELAEVLVAHGFATMGLELIVGITHPGNGASQRVLEKAGLRRVQDDHCYGQPVWRYELARTDWERPDPGARR